MFFQSNEELSHFSAKFTRRYPELVEYFDAALERELRYPIPNDASTTEKLSKLANAARQLKLNDLRKYRREILFAQMAEDDETIIDETHEAFGATQPEFDPDNYDPADIPISKLSAYPDWARMALKAIEYRCYGTMEQEAWKRRKKILKLYLAMSRTNAEWEKRQEDKFKLIYERLFGKSKIPPKTISNDLSVVRALCREYISVCQNTLTQETH